MNISVYMFGRFENGYTQYPDDNTAQIFHKFHNNTTSISQIGIHREGNLMYYGYVRKLEHDRFIGFCVVLNGVFLKELNELFGLYENLVSYLVINGRLINFNQQGEIVTNADKLYLSKDTIDIVSDNLRAGFMRIRNLVEELPPVSYGISSDIVKEFSIDDELSDIISASFTYGYTFVRKDYDYKSPQMNSYKEILERINKEKNELQGICDDLSEEIEELNKEKKQYKVVLMLGAVLLACCAGLWFFFDKLNITESELAYAQSTISVQTDSIQMKNEVIDDLYEKNANITRRYNDERVKVQQYKDALNDKQFTITSSYDFSSGYLRLNFHSVTDKDSVPFTMRVFEEGKGIIYTSNFITNIKQGSTPFETYIGGLNSNTWYSFVIFQNNQIIGGSRH